MNRLILFAVLATGLAVAADPAPQPAGALAMLNAGRVDEVISSLKNQNSAESHILMARAFYAEDKTDEAIEQAEKAVELAPNNAAYHLWLGRAYGQKAEKVNVFRQAGLAGKVREQFEKAVSLDGANADARSDLAEYYIDAPGIMGGGVDKAKAQAEAIVQKDPVTAHSIRANIAVKAKDYTTAEKEFKEAVSASKTPAEQWFNLASFYKDRQNNTAMLDAVKKAAAVPRKSGAVLSDAAELLFQSGQDLNLAADLARKYIAAKDQTDEAPVFKTHVLLGKILEKQGDKAAADKEFQSALALAKDYGPARKH